MWFLFACVSATDPSAVARSDPAPVKRLVKTHTVDCNGGADYTSITAALEKARSGDQISVAPCSYQGSLHFKGRSVAVLSTGGALETTIVATPGEPAIKVNDGEGAGTEVSGFTITGGGGVEERAIEVQSSSLTLRDDIVTGNVGTVTLYSYFGHTVVERTIFDENTASEGIVLQERRGTTVFKDSTVVCGLAPIGYINEHGAAFVDGGTFDCPGAIGIEVYHADGRVQRSVVDGLVRVENEVGSVEESVLEDNVLLAGATLVTATVTLRNVVSIGSVAATGSTVRVEGSILTEATCGVAATDSVVTIRHSDFWNNTADVCGLSSPIGVDGSFSADPRFVDRAGLDFQLQAGSPAVDSGPVGSGYLDPDGSPNDLGAFGGPLSMGGGW